MNDEERIDQAIHYLRLSRELLQASHAPRATDRVRLALKSAEGARRHASRSDIKARRAAQPRSFNEELQRGMRAAADATPIADAADAAISRVEERRAARLEERQAEEDRR